MKKITNSSFKELNLIDMCVGWVFCGLAKHTGRGIAVSECFLVKTYCHLNSIKQSEPAIFAEISLLTTRDITY